MKVSRMGGFRMSWAIWSFLFTRQIIVFYIKTISLISKKNCCLSETKSCDLDFIVTEKDLSDDAFPMTINVLSNPGAAGTPKLKLIPPPRSCLKSI